MNTLRIRLEIEGIVQGVGFRPFVYQLAKERNLSGYVMNTSSGALAEIEGSSEQTRLFLEALHRNPPPLARITRIGTAEIPPEHSVVFEIRHSETLPERTALISPDVSVCGDCLREMLDPGDRRHRYPFINCTNCGPRYTIIMDVPYDRAKTSMRSFPMCPDCEAEYRDPANRRFHAQPNACPVCGPHLELLDENGRPVPAEDPVRDAVNILKSGLILAVKGLGGFHLAVDATSDQAVKRLRARKRREEKPLAVMSPDLARLATFARTTPEEENALTSIQRPIVLLEARSPSPLAPSVAPDNRYIGAMLPYTPLHHLLLAEFTALVMTSANLSEEPIVIGNDEALRRLAGIADAYLMHNRDIHVRTDDSVIRMSRHIARPIRRSRGFVPSPVFLKKRLPPILAVGGEQKNTICLTKADRAFLSQHIGDLENMEALRFFEETTGHLQRILDIRPEAAAHDLHPDYLSTQWAATCGIGEKIAVQHHHAHIAGVMAEHGLDGPVIGLACDGSGLGDDGCIWGGEILVADLAGYERRGHLDEVPLPGGAAAVKEPWRMAVSYLHAAFGGGLDSLPLPLLERQDASRLSLLKQVVAKKAVSRPTSSLGRLFDAVAALAGLKDRAGFEGQAAMMLEMCCPREELPPYPFDLEEKNGVWLIKHQPLVRNIVSDLSQGKSQAEISGRFHAAVNRFLLETVLRLSRETGIRTIALSGGCFQNQVLLTGLTRLLTGRGFDVYTHDQVPVNDGGLSLGQAAVASRRLEDSQRGEP